MTSEPTAKKDIQRLQRAIVDGLEDVKGQDIVVFNTEHLSPLFERVIIASGTSNRQTKALASSVRDAVREAGFDKPRIEGEENGEWIIVDCGAAVAHVMQPVIRQYYRLEEIWGATPVRLKHGAVKPEAAAKPAAKKKAAAKKPEAAPVSGKKVVRKAAAKNAPAPVAAKSKSAASKPAAPKRAPAKTGAVKTGAAKTSTAKLVVGKPVAKKAPAAKKIPVARKPQPAAKKKA